MRKITRGASAGAGLIFHVFVQDSTSTTGAGKASIAYSSFTCRYIRNGEAISGAITPEDITTIGTYAAPTANTNIRIKAVDNTNMIGVYEIQIHADWVNTTNSCQSLTIFLSGTGGAVLPLQIPLEADDAQIAKPTNSNLLSINSDGRVDVIKVAGTTQTAGDLAALINTLDDFVDTEVAAIKAKTDLIPAAPAAVSDIPTANAIADQVWDELLAGHVGVGSAGLALAAAGSAGDPWSTLLPGAYGAGTAGKIIGDNINTPLSGLDTKLDTIDNFIDTEVAAIKAVTDLLPDAGALTSLATQASVNTIDDFIDTEVAAIKAKTDNLPSDPADASDIAAAFAVTNGKIDAVDDFIDTEVAAIKAKTDQLTFTVANQVDSNALTGGGMTAAATRAALGMASANLDTQLSGLDGKLDTIDNFVDTEVAAIKAKTDLIPSDPADASDIAAAFTITNGKIDAVDDFIDTEVAAIKAKTDNLPSDPADASVVAGLIAAVDAKIDILDDFVDTEVAAIKAKTDNLPSDPADASVIAGLIAALEAKVDTVDNFIDTEVAAIKAKTDLIPAAPASVGDIPTAIENADALLKRDWTSVTGEAARSTLNALRNIRNRWNTTDTPGTLTVYKEDDTTPAWTRVLETDPAAEPITGAN